MSKKCEACVYIAEYEKNHFLDKLKETTKYPVQDVCLSAYFEIDDSALCFCFHNAHAGVIANLIFQGQEDMPSLEEVTPAVTYLDKDGSADIFLLRDYKNNNEKTTRLYEKLQNVNSVAYAMVESGTLKEVNPKIGKQFNFGNANELSRQAQDYLSKEKAKGNPDFFINKEDKEIVSIRGQSLTQNVGYLAIAELGKHKGVPYLKKFTFKKLDDVMTKAEDIDEVKETASKDFLNHVDSNAHKIIGNKFNDITEFDLGEDKLNFPDLKMPEEDKGQI